MSSDKVLKDAQIITVVSQQMISHEIKNHSADVTYLTYSTV